MLEFFHRGGTCAARIQIMVTGTTLNDSILSKYRSPQICTAAQAAAADVLEAQARPQLMADKECLMVILTRGQHVGLRSRITGKICCMRPVAKVGSVPASERCRDLAATAFEFHRSQEE